MMKRQIPYIRCLTLTLLLFAAAWLMPCSAQSGRTNLFVPEMSEYSNSMTVTCVAMMGNQQLVDCEVAAFDSRGQCRGSQLSSINQEGRIYLMVYGTVSEPLHFRIVTANGQIYDCREQLTFAVDDEVGSITAPFVFNASTHDVNRDGRQSIADLTAIIRMLNGGDRTPYDVQAADIDGDGRLTINDINLFRELLMKF